MNNNDGIQNYMQIKESQEDSSWALGYTDPRELGKHHQTLVLVYGSNKSNDNFVERACRLVGSLNMTDTIKADIVTVSGNTFYRNLDFGHDPSEGEIDEEQLREFKSSYAQVLEVRTGDGND